MKHIFLTRYQRQIGLISIQYFCNSPLFMGRPVQLKLAFISLLENITQYVKCPFWLRIDNKNNIRLFFYQNANIVSFKYFVMSSDTNLNLVLILKSWI